MKSNKYFNTLFPSFSMVDKTFADLDKIFDEAGKALDGPYWYEVKNTFNKPVIDYDVKSDEKGHTLQIAIPGVKKEQVSVTAKEGNLMIKVDVEESLWTKKTDRKFSLPEDADLDAITADVADGVLTVVIPRLEAEKPKEVKVL